MNNLYSGDDLEEDRNNKPWRPIPAGRLSIEETRFFMVGSYIAAILASVYIEGFPECLAIMVQGWVYNELGAANDSCLTRNILNATGKMNFAAGVAKVACTQFGTIMQVGPYPWFMFHGAVIATTIQFQDLYDQNGDSARCRRTVPLVVGDSIARLSIGVPIAVWSILCPAFWHLDAQGFVFPSSFGGSHCLRDLPLSKCACRKNILQDLDAWAVVL